MQSVCGLSVDTNQSTVNFLTVWYRVERIHIDVHIKDLKDREIVKVCNVPRTRDFEGALLKKKNIKKNKHKKPHMWDNITTAQN